MPIRFQVDPDFYDHPKVLDLSDAAVALWTKAGSYCAAKLTDGFVAHNALALLSKIPADAAEELRRYGLWHKVKGGYQFHEWGQRNLLKSRVEADREADRKRKRQTRGTATHAAGQNGNPQAEPHIVRPESNRSPGGIQPESDRIPDVSVSVSESVSVSGSGHGARPPNTAGTAALGPRPPQQCSEHKDDPDPPACRRCKGSREAAEAWDVKNARANAERQRTQPQCPRHRGQPAHNCRDCRSERIAADGPPAVEFRRPATPEES